MLRVRQIISKLNYESLLERGIIPDLKTIISEEAGTSKRLPGWVYKELKNDVGANNFSFFGYYMDYMVRKMISDHIPVIWNEKEIAENPVLKKFLDPENKWNNVAYEALELTANYLGLAKGTLNISPATFAKTYGLLGAINKSVGIMFSNSAESKVEFSSEFLVPITDCNNNKGDNVGIQGHPDIISLNMVLDIKTTQNFNKMADESFLQILSYVAIMRHNNRIVDYTGILLPLQTALILVDIREWDSKPFLQILANEVSLTCTPDLPTDLQSIITAVSCISSVGPTLSKTIILPTLTAKGNHQKKTLKMSEALNNYVNEMLANGEEFKPAQIFFHGNITMKLDIKSDEIAKVAQLIYNTGLRLYIHAPYTINLSNPVTSKTPTDTEPVLKITEQHLETAATMGCRGVVLHVGKAVGGMKISEGLDKMEESIRRVISHSTETCPFLLETPVGAGNEVGWQVGEFIDFYDRFTPEEKRRFKICIDTCHVWAAGYEPMEYITRWEARHGANSVALIHFNDSKNKKGSRTDRHAPCGSGYIGYPKLALVAQWADSNNIDMVFE